MRLLCYALLLLAVVFATSSEATSTIKSFDQNEISELTASDIDILNRILEVKDDDKRLLRGTAETEDADQSADGEERGFKIPLPSSISKVLAKWSAKLATWKEGMFTRAFEHLVNNKMTPEKLAERLKMGSGFTEPRLAKFHAKFKVCPDGHRDTEKDQNCTQIVLNGESGYCELEDVDSGERFRVMRRHCNSIRHDVPFRCQSAPDFVNFRVEIHNTAERALIPSFVLPNVVETEQVPRDGIVMVVYPKLLASAYATIKVLRKVLGCRLPIEIWYRPDEMKPNDGILAPLRHLAEQEKTITFQEIRDPLAKRFVAKIHAIYYSSFDRVLFLDADNAPVRDPSFLFESSEFVKTGAIFWPDFWFPDSTIFGVHENSLLWEFLDMSFVDMFEQESGQLVVDRRRHAAPLELVRLPRLAWLAKSLTLFSAQISVE
ncbi:hypothetical protein JM16_006472 [Phytophthora kernoviae]|uniref:RxLR effector protein n=1 Tax=Phytophthora kernoviae TaxID=325452 RepID=A0A8T0LTS8_9STRA|nr:hypothetical protein JM16_006472 [Phytophthora kernoviae]